VLPLLFLIMQAIEWHYRDVAEEIAISCQSRCANRAL
jgi:hypothetical protein